MARISCLQLAFLIHSILTDCDPTLNHTLTHLMIDFFLEILFLCSFCFDLDVGDLDFLYS